MRVTSMTWEAEDVLSVELRAADGSRLARPEPGAHVEVTLRSDLIRHYSLCGDVTDESRWRIAVLRDRNSRGGSVHVHDVLRPGAVVSVVGPRNEFPLEPAGSYLFIAGGIGITPFLPMIRAAESAGARWRLLYGGRQRSSMAFLDQLVDYGERVTVAPEDEVGLLDLPAAVAAAGPETVVYCCGPGPLIAAVESTCRDLGRPAPHIEHFGAHADAPDVHREGDTAFEVELTQSGLRLHIPADRSILDVLTDAGVYVPVSCDEGYCGTCETEVVEGVPDHRDDYLSPEEREANDRMMVCVGRSRCELLRLKL